MGQKMKKTLIVCMCFLIVWNFFFDIPLLQQVLPATKKAKAMDYQTPVPVLLEAKELTASSVRIKWSSDSSFRGAYFIFRKSKETDYGIVGGMKATGKASYTFTDKNVLAGKEYMYSVAAIPEEAMEDVCNGSSSAFSSQNYGKTTLKWEEPYTGTVRCFLVFADGKLEEIKDSSIHTATYTYAYDYNAHTGEPDFQVYALLNEKDLVDSSNTMSAKTTLLASKVKKVYLVGNKKARIDWTKSKGATGYTVYRRTSPKESWKKIATVSGENQVYCYDNAVSAKKNYYYAVRAFVKADSGKAFASYSGEKKAYFKKVSVVFGKGDYKAGSVYGPALTSKQLSQVKAVVNKFCKDFITTDMSNLEKVLAAQLYMAGTCVYAPTWAKNGANTAWGSLVYKNSKGYHEAQCSGFARGFKALCDAMGVRCRYVHANAKSVNSNHQWNEVRVDGKWYIVDPQCNATSGFLAYFLCSGKTYTKTSGMKWDKKSYPALSAKDYSTEKINAAYKGYKIQKVYKKIFK